MLNVVMVSDSPDKRTVMLSSLLKSLTESGVYDFRFQVVGFSDPIATGDDSPNIALIDTSPEKKGVGKILKQLRESALQPAIFFVYSSPHAPGVEDEAKRAGACACLVAAESKLRNSVELDGFFHSNLVSRLQTAAAMA